MKGEKRIKYISIIPNQPTEAEADRGGLPLGKLCPTTADVQGQRGTASRTGEKKRDQWPKKALCSFPDTFHSTSRNFPSFILQFCICIINTLLSLQATIMGIDCVWDTKHPPSFVVNVVLFFCAINVIHVPECQVRIEEASSLAFPPSIFNLKMLLKYRKK